MLLSTREHDKIFWNHVAEFDRKLEELTTQKGGDYNRVCDLPDYCPNGWKDAGLHLWKCALRLLNFLLTDAPVHSKNEAVEDTLFDIVNWARFAYGLKRLEEDKRMAESLKKDGGKPAVPSIPRRCPHLQSTFMGLDRKKKQCIDCGEVFDAEPEKA